MKCITVVVLHIAACHAGQHSVPVVDIRPICEVGASPEERRSCVAAIGEACMTHGFLYIRNHGVSEELQQRLREAFESFVEQPAHVKRAIEMAKAGNAWRGYFAVGEELTKGVVDQKEGLYFAAEHDPDDPRPLHGANLFPDEAMREAVLEYMAAMTQLSRALLTAIGEALELPPHVFSEHFEEPTTLFRCFHYPPHDERWGAASEAVGEHTDMGFLTVLKQDDSGGLQARAGDAAEWIDVPPLPGTFVVNLGDCLERYTGGLLRATAHRVKQRVGATKGRFSFPFFFDPSFDAKMKSCVAMLPEALRERARERMRNAPERWDGRDLQAYEGSYRDFIISKVSMVFPELAKQSGVQAA